MRACAFIFVTILCLSIPSCCQSQALQGKLDQKEHQLEQLWAEYWRTQYAIDSGEQKDASVQPVRAKINAVMLDSGFLRELQRTQFTDPLFRAAASCFCPMRSTRRSMVMRNC